jgi:HlyD family secretion protein
MRQHPAIINTTRYQKYHQRLIPSRLSTILVILAILITATTTMITGCNQTDDRPIIGEIIATGFIEGNTYDVLSDYGGIVKVLNVAENDQVSAGAILLNIENLELLNLYEQAILAEQSAENKLLKWDEYPTVQDISMAEANLAAKQTAFIEAEANLSLLEIAYRPQDPPKPERRAVRAALKIAREELTLARAQLDQVKAGLPVQQLDVLKANLASAKASTSFQAQLLERLQIASPISGIVHQILVKTGEIATPGATLIRLIDPRDLEITVYVPVSDISYISPGNPVLINVDAYPNQPFTGRVQYIADTAQFTPSDVQTTEERVKQVFAIRISTKDYDGRLKPGMPADVQIATNAVPSK